MRYRISEIELLSYMIGENKLLLTEHFLERSKSSNRPNFSEISKIMKKNSVVGIVFQGFNKYLLTFDYDSEYEVNIVLSVGDTSSLNIVTSFPISKKRRLKPNV